MAIFMYACVPLKLGLPYGPRKASIQYVGIFICDIKYGVG